MNRDQQARARALRRQGLSIRAIAAELKVPHTTVADYLRSIDAHVPEVVITVGGKPRPTEQRRYRGTTRQTHERRIEEAVSDLGRQVVISLASGLYPDHRPDIVGLLRDAQREGHEDQVASEILDQVLAGMGLGASTELTRRSARRLVQELERRANFRTDSGWDGSM